MILNIAHLDKSRIQSGRKQSGAVLIVAMSLLVILTILGISVMESSVIEEKMAGNNLDRNVAFQSAESALRAAETWISQQTQRPVPTATPGADRVMTIDTFSAGGSWWREQDAEFWVPTTAPATPNVSTFAPTDATLGEQVAFLPRYAIEEYDVVCDGAVNDPSASTCKVIYRITARGWGGSESSSVMLQSLYAKRF
jgi:type IV pilus assembly protein PilX